MGQSASHTDQEPAANSHAFAIVADIAAAPLKICEGDAEYVATDSDAFGHCTARDQTGCFLWSASLALARWLANDERAQSYLAGCKVVELGAGCGAPGIAAALYCRCASVMLTDLSTTTLDNLRANAALNRPACTTSCEVSALDWAATEESWRAVVGGSTPVDTVLGSDLTYTADGASLIGSVVRALLARDGVFIYCFTSGDRFYLASELLRDGAFALEHVEEWMPSGSGSAGGEDGGDEHGPPHTAGVPPRMRCLAHEHSPEEETCRAVLEELETRQFTLQVFRRR